MPSKIYGGQMQIRNAQKPCRSNLGSKVADRADRGPAWMQHPLHLAQHSLPGPPVLGPSPRRPLSSRGGRWGFFLARNFYAARASWHWRSAEAAPLTGRQEVLGQGSRFRRATWLNEMARSLSFRAADTLLIASATWPKKSILDSKRGH
jgi:hypothetical protein